VKKSGIPGGTITARDADPVEGEPGIVLVALVPVRNRLLEAGKRFTPGIDGR
jgi:hypothetical protein